MSKIYDVIVLGAGPAGLAAGLYAGRSRLSVLIIEKGQDGGQIAITDEIENYGNWCRNENDRNDQKNLQSPACLCIRPACSLILFRLLILILISFLRFLFALF